MKKQNKPSNMNSRKNQKRGSRGKGGVKPVELLIRAPKKVMKRVGRVSRKVDADMIAKGAAMMAVAAGMVATGAVLSKEKNRDKIARTAKKGMRSMGEIVSNLSKEAREVYPMVAHELRRDSLGKKGPSKKRLRNKKG